MVRRPQKRRRISIDSNGAASSTSHFTPSPYPEASLSPAAEAPPPDVGTSSCVSCHRSLAHNAGGPSKQNQAVMCERCRSYMCSICARKCTAVPPSLPPTPQLSYSPSPPGSPRRPELDSTRRRCQRTWPEPQGDLRDDCSSADGENAPQVHVAGRRRQRKDEDDEEGTVVGADDHLETVGGHGEGESNGGDAMLMGCERIVCKNCSIEHIQSGNSTCYDCYGVPPPSSYDPTLHSHRMASSTSTPSNVSSLSLHA